MVRAKRHDIKIAGENLTAKKGKKRVRLPTEALLSPGEELTRKKKVKAMSRTRNSRRGRKGMDPMKNQN